MLIPVSGDSGPGQAFPQWKVLCQRAIEMDLRPGLVLRVRILTIKTCAKKDRRFPAILLAEIHQPDGWFGPKQKANWPGIVNLRLDPFERTTIGQSLKAIDWWGFQFWRFVFVQEEVAKLAKTATDFPPMQPGASFNLSEIKAKIEKAQTPQGK